MKTDEDGFIPVMLRRKRRVLGCAGSSVTGLEGAPPPLRHIWVSRIQRGTADTLSDFIENQNVKVFHSEKVSHVDAKFSSFKISISKNDLAKVLQDSFWPQGVQCQPWHEHTRRSAARRPDTGSNNTSPSTASTQSSGGNKDSIPAASEGLNSDSVGADNAGNVHSRV